MSDAMNAKLRFGVILGATVPVCFVASGMLTSNTITISHNAHSFEILTDVQAGAMISGDELTGSLPLLNYINTVKNTVPKLFKQTTLSKLYWLIFFLFVICISSQTIWEITTQ